MVIFFGTDQLILELGMYLPFNHKIYFRVRLVDSLSVRSKLIFRWRRNMTLGPPSASFVSKACSSFIYLLRALRAVVLMCFKNASKKDYIYHRIETM